MLIGVVSGEGQGIKTLITSLLGLMAFIGKYSTCGDLLIGALGYQCQMKLAANCVTLKSAHQCA